MLFAFLLTVGGLECFLESCQRQPEVIVFYGTCCPVQDANGIPVNRIRLIGAVLILCLAAEKLVSRELPAERPYACSLRCRQCRTGTPLAVFQAQSSISGGGNRPYVDIGIVGPVKNLLDRKSVV